MNGTTWRIGVNLTATGMTHMSLDTFLEVNNCTDELKRIIKDELNKTYTRVDLRDFARCDNTWTKETNLDGEKKSTIKQLIPKARDEVAPGWMGWSLPILQCKLNEIAS